ncbi:MAG: MBL fold metallo-hydrolase [Croceibacterium sp.]
MRRIAILASITIAGLAAACVSAQQPPAAPPTAAQGAAPARPAGGGLPGITDIEKVSDHVYKIFGAGGNTTVFIRSDGVTLVDTKLANNGQAILDQVKKVTDKPVTMIINTHSHPDHMGSNKEIVTARGSIQIVAQTNSAVRMAALPTPPVDTKFDDRLTIGSGADQIDLYWFGAAHTDGDAFVVFPAERVMCAGDTMAWNMGLLVDPGSGGSMVATPDTVGRAAATIKNVDRVIEGHGDANTWAGFLRYVGYTRKVVDLAKRGVAEGLDYTQVYDKYFVTDPTMAPYTLDVLKPGLEYGGTPKTRSLNNLYVAMGELRGEKVPLIMGAPPRPGEAPRGPGGPGGAGGARQAPAGDEHVL